MGALSVRNVVKAYGHTVVLDHVSLDVRDRELLALVGPSGCGKSTLLRVIAGLEPPDSGSIAIGGTPADDRAPHERDIAMVFQSHALYPHLTVRENIAMPLVMRRLTRRQRWPLVGRLMTGASAARAGIDADVRDVAAMLGLGDLLDRKPAQLSGGQRQRVAIGRALVRHPNAFLMDEPLSSLDPSLRLQLRLEILKLRQRLGTTILYVTHDRSEALSMADRIAVMRHGRLLQIDTAAMLDAEPAHVGVAEFIAEAPLSRIAGRVRETGGVDTEIGVMPIDTSRVDVRAGDDVVILLGADSWRVVPCAPGTPATATPATATPATATLATGTPTTGTLAPGTAAAGMPAAGTAVTETAATATPATAMPATGTPAIGAPATGRPAAGTLATGTPAPGTPTTATPATGTPAIGTPATGRPAAGTFTTAAGMPAAGTLETGTPAARTPAAGTLATGTPASGTLGAGAGPMPAGAIEARVQVVERVAEGWLVHLDILDGARAITMRMAGDDGAAVPIAGARVCVAPIWTRARLFDKDGWRLRVREPQRPSIVQASSAVRDGGPLQASPEMHRS